MPGALVNTYLDRYQQLVKLLTSTKGEPLEGLAPELLVDLTLEQAPALAYDWYYLMGTTRYSINQTIAANVGHVGQIDLFNPSPAGLLVVVENVQVNNANLNSPYILTLDGGAAGGTPASGTPLDQREPLSKKSGAQVFIGNGAVGFSGNVIDKRTCEVAGKDLNFVLFAAAVLAPGRRLNLWNFTQNQGLDGSIVWRERQLGASELKSA